ncbi:amidohydrolase [Cellvibrio zantedeschiae]|uniref:Amidohydrolase n=1 Tax=Cellvibrio zantedeschiae TaxID=1237077 RepID=A0ABQ3B3W7_9GAMM|nr:amidohydrolase family protein [Cellvibrio zantedeschiae]GGY73503.1 amidohydrolase [Cellvibrio zantedeschiae]
MIDAHQHFWRIGENDCRWPTADLTAIYRDFNPVDLEPLTKAAGITGSVLVQSQESDADTDFLLRLANESDLVKAVVGWVDLKSITAVPRIRNLAQHPKMRGLRPMLQSLPEDSWILSPDIEIAIAEMQQCNLSLDALVHVRHLQYLRIFARRHPKLAIVIDHAAKPAIAAKGFESWAKAIAALAELPQVYCKLSGLLTEASMEQGVDHLRPYIVHLYHLFGAERLMWGSDWPVLNLAPNHGNYDEWLTLAKQILPVASATELDEIFGTTAKNFYRF